MRVIGWVVGVIVLIVVLLWLDVGQGVEACLRDCRAAHCGREGASLEDCDDAEGWRACRDACYEEHGGP